MSFNPHWSIARINAAMDTRLTTLGSGFIEIYTGTQPANPDAALSGNTLLVTLTFGATAFGSSSGGVATANSITAGTAVATGTATFFRCFQSNNTTAVFDGSVGASGSFDMLIPSTSIASGQSVPCTSFTFTEVQ